MEIKDQIKKLSRGSAEIIDIKSLEKKLQDSQKNKKPLRVKAGFDPTAPDIHLGHVVLLRKLRQFQDLGHKVLFLIGDFTALVGDPTGRNELRPAVELSVIRENAKTYAKQALKILDDDPKKIEIVYNYDWLSKLTAQEMLELTAYSTVAQMLARSDFKKRYESGSEISIMEFLYPLLQGYDSVYLNADIELGGNDQKFNLLMGRQLQEIKGQVPQVIIMTPLLEGLDGVKKMSKSLSNYIGVTEPPKEIFGKIMSISDELMFRYFEILTDLDLDELKSIHPKEAKMKLGLEIVGQFYDANEAQRAKNDFENTFSLGKTPENIAEYSMNESGSQELVDVLLETGLVESKNEYRRLIKQGAISCDGKKIITEEWVLKEGLIRVGKKRFLKIV
ncbi:MAG: tyrosine--tRNA ligase [Omnitrophica WOR_2 bacterium GWF2_38_59]|nr:MAG: tyrosine--tRNA ligase [Omnitrophica WOR_2 bacterium GWA2_37_7]OGX25254.1 MAG: tyrosine--tRNA ligase [Omnitrophica WOR_2 bacterium GWF2_38_59]OGX47926.1 MAG: tyrosine--tRNA ligase [Omnitrophica WOR_2 bacterium RIFOXYA2_FULL_38_17]OGX52426.1 MAG: tyrosine--tRNA ligase [Omnitrophica WOR_2 bacterium RIFOXYA12_FULL_38_10]OGX56263.1 MAG: tyrosine--tRNA ligase [Omnitrophica WOR_2 bacterium RIFOXYC2_FULL_38_12]OGX60232.1 MAG: tyrosine--tRNA ligase [Omnitrophica WOR_2 bacterium RIFOXYB2_FULL_38